MPQVGGAGQLVLGKRDGWSARQEADAFGQLLLAKRRGAGRHMRRPNARLRHVSVAPACLASILRLSVPALMWHADDEDNFVVGMGLDCSCTAVEVPHPTDATAPDLPPQPVLLVRCWGPVCALRGLLLCYASLHAVELAVLAHTRAGALHMPCPNLIPNPRRLPHRTACCAATPLAAWIPAPAALRPAWWRRRSRCRRLRQVWWREPLRPRCRSRLRQPRSVRLARRCLTNRISR